jgi:hypothetical protein
MTEYGLIANLLAAPIVSLLIMPMALLNLTAMPFGLEAWPLKAMGFGIDAMVWIGQWVAGWPGAVTVLPQISGAALVLMVLGGLWLCLWQTRTRALGLVIAACGLALAPPATRPDVLIDRDGQTAALRSEGGSLIFPPATAAGYSVDNWLLADGDGRDAGAASSDAFKCDLLGCIGAVKGKIVALIRHPAALEEDCRLADIVIAPFSIGKRCGAARVIVDRHVLKEQGAHALYIEGLSIRTETVAELRGRRPWVPDRTPMRADRPPAWGQTNAPGGDDSGADAPDPPPRRRPQSIGTNSGGSGPPAGLERARDQARRCASHSSDWRLRAPAQALQRGLGLVDQRHDDVAVIGVLAALHDDGIAFEDAGVDHGIAFDLQRVMLALAQQLGRHLDGAEPGLDRIDRHAGGDAAHDRHADRLGQALALGDLGHASQAALDHARREAARALSERLRHRFRKLDDLHGARPVGQPAHEAALLERGDEPMDAGFRLEVERFLHLIEGGRHAGLLQPLMDEHEKLFLLRGEHLVPFERFGLASFGALTIRLLARTKHEHFICSVCVPQAGMPPNALEARL